MFKRIFGSSSPSKKVPTPKELNEASAKAKADALRKQMAEEEDHRQRMEEQRAAVTEARQGPAVAKAAPVVEGIEERILDIEEDVRSNETGEKGRTRGKGIGGNIGGI